MNWGVSEIAFFWGIASAVSLPIGAGIGIYFRPGKTVTSAMMAFGAGALLFALTIELFGHVLHIAHEQHNPNIVYVTAVGAIIGALIFDFFNQLLNNRGAFLRNLSNTKRYLGRTKLLTARRIVQQLSPVSLLRKLPPGDMALLLPHVRFDRFDAGRVIFQQGKWGDTLYFIIEGEIELSRKDEQGEVSSIVLKDGGTFGVLGVVTGNPRFATATALAPTKVYKIVRSDLEAVASLSPELRESIEEVTLQRWKDLSKRSPDTPEGWQEQVLARLTTLSAPVVTEQEIDQELQEQAKRKGAAIAIWLGITIDAVPESLVIGLLAVSPQGISYAFVAGVFLANLPEAMSSSVGLKKGGIGRIKIFWMWMSICIMTGVGAFIGTLMFSPDPSPTTLYYIAGIEGLAAGAMLTAIAESMLPEAFEQGGAIVGMATLLGFLAAMLVKLV